MYYKTRVFLAAAVRNSITVLNTTHTTTKIVKRPADDAMHYKTRVLD